MKKGKLVAALFLSLVLIAQQFVFASTLNPNVPPGGNFNLSGWTLQLPTGSTGNPDTVSGSDLENGFTNIYFYTDKSDGAMAMMDPTTGVTTSGSQHCRTEFRENTSGWSTSVNNVLSATVAVPQVPSNVCIGQIFQATGPSKPLCELQYAKSGSISLLLEQTNQGGSSTTTKVASVSAGSQFTYALSLTGTTITVTINGAKTTFTMPDSFIGETFYFKAGDYDQTATAGTPGTVPGTVVKFYTLDVTHGSATPTPTPTATPTPTGTATPTPAGTATPTPAGTATPTPAATATPTPAGTATPTPAATPTPTPGGVPAWAPNTAYSVGQLVTYSGSTYKCLQAHTSIVGWEPPNVPALWQLQ